MQARIEGIANGNDIARRGDPSWSPCNGYAENNDRHNDDLRLTLAALPLRAMINDKLNVILTAGKNLSADTAYSLASARCFTVYALSEAEGFSLTMIGDE